MDDLKLLGKSRASKAGTTFTDDIRMESGLHKCAKIVYKKRKLVHSQNVVVDNREIQELTSTLGLRKVMAYNISK
jgi:hypothetical protein